jgi:phosphatidylglycerophosphate synthase
MRKLGSHIPLALTLCRAGLAPVIGLLAVYYPNRYAFGSCLIFALLSDVFDGVIARRLNIASPTLRRLDSSADSLFYAGAAFAVWHLHPTVIREHFVALVVLASTEIVRYAVDVIKFRREASYHMWSSKVWGLLLFVGFFELLVRGASESFIAIAIYVGVVADLEGLAISLLLRHWQADIATIFHALRLRNATVRDAA